jgi:multidrug transporter EmrE-like cation transporter
MGVGHMSWIIWGLVIVSVGLSAIAQLSMKIGMTNVRGSDESFVDQAILIATSPYVIGGLSLYGLGAVLWLMVLSKIPLSTAYPLVSLGFVFVAFLSWAVLGETLPVTRLVGIGLILGGVMLVGSS